MRRMEMILLFMDISCEEFDHNNSLFLSRQKVIKYPSNNQYLCAYRSTSNNITAFLFNHVKISTKTGTDA